MTNTVSAKEKALLIASASLDKKADNTLILDLQKLSPVADYFVITSAASNRQVKAIAEGIIEKMSSYSIHSGHKEGYAQGLWILLDYGDVVAHIFYSETREFYGLERLWADAPTVLFNQ